ncbi:hypothetical protein ACGUFB_04770 [Actinotignum schaalii]|uniref:hypothetical protein n=1 Tax=Actinotignum schaalii TaxID=59505 RepID=UPI00373E2C73
MAASCGARCQAVAFFWAVNDAVLLAGRFLADGLAEVLVHAIATVDLDAHRLRRDQLAARVTVSIRFTVGQQARHRRS